MLTKLQTRQLKKWSLESLLFSIQTGSGALPVGPLIQMVPGLCSGVETDRSSGPLTSI